MAVPPTNTPIATQSPGSSLSDLLTAVKNLVTALNGAAQNYLNVNGSTNFAALTAPKVVKASAGRIARVSVIVAGSGTGIIYDGATLSATTKPVFVIPDTVGIYEVNLPLSFGLLVVPGTGMTVSGGYS